MDIDELYEYIFCSQEGHKNRNKLLKKYKHRLPELAKEHEKSGLEINGKVVPFKEVI